MQPAAGAAPVGEQFSRRCRGEFFGARVDESGRVLGRLVQYGGEAGFVGDGGERDAVGPQQVRDLMGDRPPR